MNVGKQQILDDRDLLNWGLDLNPKQTIKKPSKKTKLQTEMDKTHLSWGFDFKVTKGQDFNKINTHGWEFYQDEDRAIGPYFTNQILMRVRQKKACNIIIVGEAGIWKSYCAIQIARILQRKFSVLQIVYHYSQYYTVLMAKKYRRGSPIVFDEPQDAIDHRDWYKQAQQALVKTITSQRFMVKPLFVPIISPNLIDKTIRDYLVQYQIECTDRGKARVFRLSPSLKEDKTYYNHICNLEYGLMDNDLCDKDSCLGCKKFKDCQIFRALYEKNKEATQTPKYEQQRQDALKKESRELTVEQLAEKIFPLHDKFTQDGQINVKKMRVIVRQPPLNIYIGHNKAYDIRTLLEYRYPQEFQGNT